MRCAIWARCRAYCGKMRTQIQIRREIGAEPWFHVDCFCFVQSAFLVFFRRWYLWSLKPLIFRHGAFLQPPFRHKNAPGTKKTGGSEHAECEEKDKQCAATSAKTAMKDHLCNYPAIISYNYSSLEKNFLSLIKKYRQFLEKCYTKTVGCRSFGKKYTNERGNQF